jgi:spore coat polysaccharide biosynthesis protein SpsF (cytidylyltransferase family)
VLGRCREIAGAHVICCAVSEEPDSDPVAEEAADCGVEVFRGSETDVLDRYYRAAKNLKADVILRVTSDCPLIDPTVCGKVLRLRESENADYACNNLPPEWPHGLDCEAFVFPWLERAAREETQPGGREHVSPYLRAHSEVKKVNLAAPDDGMRDYRWTLDYPEDMEFLKALFAKLPVESKMPGVAEIIELLERHPAISAINFMRRDISRAGTSTAMTEAPG